MIDKPGSASISPRFRTIFPDQFTRLWIIGEKMPSNIKRNFLHIGIIIALGFLASNCASNLPASVAGGECRIFRPPDYAIRGKHQVDQDYIDDFEEAGIAGCHWARPKARPAAKVAAKSKPSPVVTTAPTTTVPAKKRHWWQRK